MSGPAQAPAGLTMEPMNWRRLYVLACFLYFLLNVIVIQLAGLTGRQALMFAVMNAVPPSLLGIPVIRYYRPRVWRNVVIGIAFAIGTVALIQVIDWLIDRQRYTFRMEYAAWSLFISGLLFVILVTASHVKQVQLDLAQAEAARARAELSALRARIDPHFLFNTLHSLLALVRQDPGRAEEAIEQFADILRYTFAAGDGSEERTLGQEWELVDNYLALERLRLGARLRVTARLDADVAGTPLPVLTLQPLVENAVRHAIAPRAAGGRIDIRAERTGGVVRISVSDDGPGPDADKLARATGRGLHLVRERLDRMYRGAATMDLARSPEGGCRVTITVKG